MAVKGAGWTNSKSYELPVKRITSLIVERKSVVPFATVLVLAAIVTVVARYNALWFLVDLTQESAMQLSTIALVVTIVAVIPVLSRGLFVNVLIGWDGEPASFRVRFVPANCGRKLAKRFQQLTIGS